MADGKDHLRIGDSDRAKVIATLGRHYEDGRLTNEEYVSRMEAATDAQIRSDLKKLTKDLPKLPAVRESRRPVPPVDRFIEVVGSVRWFWVFIALAWAMIIAGQIIGKHP